MIATRGRAGWAVVALARQTCLSILGTVAATTVLTVLKQEWAPRAAAPSAVAARMADPMPPSLTPGGKFAARAIAGGEPEAFVTLTVLPPILPLFTAPAVPALDLTPPGPAAIVASAAALDPTPLPDPAAAARAARGHAARHIAAAPSPLRGAAAGVVAMAALPELPPTAADAPSLWSRSKAAAQQVAGWSGALVDTLLP